MADFGPQSAYLGEAGRAYHEGKRSLPPGALPWVARARAELFQPHLDETAAVFEWGCGFGWNLGGLRCSRRVGFDIAPELESSVRSAGVEFVHDPAELTPASFDVVLCHHALEHVPDPWRVLRELRRLAKSDGRLLLAVPFEQERRYRRFNPAEPNHHLFSWNVQTLGNLATAAGWRCENIGLRRYGYDRRAAQIAVRFRVGERGFRAIRTVLQRVIPLYEIALIGRPHLDPQLT
ncbi:MAG TPA: methyltransferase domain-containing protein [Verrucomicrobiota bacterium]|nr:methyltransferase domain-containing protein [Verrucomicrobiota bacterium]